MTSGSVNPLSSGAWGYTPAPQGLVGPLPVDTFGHSTRSVQEGGEMKGNMFVTSRGDQISHPHGRQPQQGRIGGPYPKIDEVSEGIRACWKPLPKLVEDSYRG